jgi:hypothetical protein
VHLSFQINLTSHAKVLTSRAKTTHALSRLDAALAFVGGPLRADSQPAAGSLNSFDCKAMRELETNLKCASLIEGQRHASNASSSIFLASRGS